MCIKTSIADLCSDEKVNRNERMPVQEWKRQAKSTRNICVYACIGPGIPLACCFHKTLYARHGLQCQTSICRAIRFKTLLTVCFGQACPVCHDCPPSQEGTLHTGSVCPSILPAAGWGGELGTAWASWMHREERTRGGCCWLLPPRPVAFSPGSIKLIQCYFSPSKNYITLWILATSPRRQGENSYCQASVHLLRPGLFFLRLLPSASLAVNLLISATLQAKLQPAPALVYAQLVCNRRLRSGGGQHAQAAHVNISAHQSSYKATGIKLKLLLYL